MHYVDSSDDCETTDLDSEVNPAHVNDPGQLALQHPIPTLDVTKSQGQLSEQCAEVLAAWAKDVADLNAKKEADNAPREAYSATVKQQVELSESELKTYSEKLARAKERMATRKGDHKRAREAVDASHKVWNNRIKETKTTSVTIAETLEAVKQVTQCPY